MPPAEAVILGVEGDRAQVWLGGIHPQNITAFGKGAVLNIIDSQGKPQGEVELESRNGLEAKGKLQGSAKPGSLLQEKMRVIAHDISLTIGLDPSLGKDTIVLAPDGKDNGLLTASDILNLKLNAELVVLSACDTGRGRINGDGVIGLSRSLISAGVPSLVVTLWKIPDESSEKLMTQFYQNLQQNPDKAQALRQAMLTTMKQYPETINWAAFTFIGETE